MPRTQSNASGSLLLGFWYVLLAPLPLLSALVGGGGFLLILGDDSRGGSGMFSGLATGLGIVGLVLGGFGFGVTLLMLATSRRSASGVTVLSTLGGAGLLLVSGGLAAFPPSLQAVGVAWTLGFVGVSFTASKWPGLASELPQPPSPPQDQLLEYAHAAPTPSSSIIDEPQPPPPPRTPRQTQQGLSREAARYQQLRKRR